MSSSFTSAISANSRDLHAPAPFLQGSGAYGNEFFLPPSERTSPSAASTAPAVEFIDNSFDPPHTYASVKILSPTVNTTSAAPSVTATITSTTTITETKPNSFVIPFDSTYAQILDVSSVPTSISSSTKQDATKSVNLGSTNISESSNPRTPTFVVCTYYLIKNYFILLCYQNNYLFSRLISSHPHMQVSEK